MDAFTLRCFRYDDGAVIRFVSRHLDSVDVCDGRLGEDLGGALCVDAAVGQEDHVITVPGSEGQVVQAKIDNIDGNLAFAKLV